MILELDCGNSRIKWRQLEPAGTIRSRGVCSGLHELQQVLQSHQQSFSLIRYCSVRDGDFAARLAELLQQYSGSLLQARSQRQQAGVTNAYEEYWRLGSDRWLVMLAGYQRCGGNCVIVDCGTAITVDFINAAGQHLGGVIAPGLRLLQQSLPQATGLRQPEVLVSSELRYGDNTELALAAGINSMCRGFFACQAQTATELFGVDSQIIMTGGDAGELHQFYPQAQLAPELLFEGLALVGAEAGQ